MGSYATLAQLYALGVNAEALAQVAKPDQDEALEAASRLVDTYLWKLNPPLAVFTGEITEAAVKALQELNDLNPDGKVGPLTWRALQALDVKVSAGGKVLQPA